MAHGHDSSWEVGDTGFFVKSCMVEFARHVAHNFTGDGQPAATDVRVLFCSHVLDLQAKCGVDMIDLPLPCDAQACHLCFACVASILFILLEFGNELHLAPPQSQWHLSHCA